MKTHLGFAGDEECVVLIDARQARERARIYDGAQGGETRLELLVGYQAQRIGEALALGGRGSRKGSGSRSGRGGGSGRAGCGLPGRLRIMRRMAAASRERDDREPRENSK